MALALGPDWGLRAATSTVQPSAASTSAQARPMPFEPPVTSARFPLSFRSISRQSSKMPQIKTGDGVKLHYEECGSGVPVVFVHEFAGDIRSWEPQISHFSRRYRCIAYNARGYPPSRRAGELRALFRRSTRATTSSP